MPEELIFFALIVIFTLLDGVLRKKKPGQVPGPDDWEPPEDWDDDPAPTLGEPPTAARRPTGRGRPGFDDPTIPGRPMEEYTKPYGAASGRGASRAPAAGGVPGEVWEEIARLARGERVEPEAVEDRDVERRYGPPASPRSGSSPGAGTNLPAPIGRGEVGTKLPAPIGRGEVGTRADLFEHPVHGSHADYGTDPSARRRNVAVVEGERVSADVRAVRSMLGGGRHQLRRAVILQEMLGPPVSLRDPDDPGAI